MENWKYNSLVNHINCYHLNLKKIRKILIGNDQCLATSTFVDYLRRRKKPKYFFDIKEREYLVKAIKNLYPQEVRDIIQRAELLKRRTILFRNKWDMERTVEPQIMKDQINWSFTPNGDPEWFWMFNRHRFLVDLGKAYWLTGDEEYAKVLIFYIRDWIKKNQLISSGFKMHSWRPLDVGIRLVNWIKIMNFIMHSQVFTEDDFIIFLNNIINHTQFLFTYNFPTNNNPNIISTCGLGVAAIVFPEFTLSPIWLRETLRRLKHALNSQILKDGIL